MQLFDCEVWRENYTVSLVIVLYNYFLDFLHEIIDIFFFVGIFLRHDVIGRENIAIGAVSFWEFIVNNS
jgi:hypothetical protein